MIRSLCRLAVVILLLLPINSTGPQPYAGNIAKAESYLILDFSPVLGLVHESDDPGQHWLRYEFPGFKWRYDQTYWLYSDNLFAMLALRRDYPAISSRIKAAIQSYGQSPANFFEVVSGERIHFPLHDAADFIISNTSNYIIMMRRHNVMVGLGMVC